jgi:hypothetical protein
MEQVDEKNLETMLNSIPAFDNDIFTASPSDYPYPIVDQTLIGYPVEQNEGEFIIYLGSRCTKITSDSIIEYSAGLEYKKHTIQLTPKLFYNIYTAYLRSLFDMFIEPFKTGDYLTAIFYEPKKYFLRLSQAANNANESDSLETMMKYDNLLITIDLPENIEDFYLATVSKKSLFNAEVIEKVYGVLDTAFDKASK